MNIEKPETLFAFDERGEGINDLRVLEVEFVGVPNHFQVIADDKENAVVHFLRNIEPVQEVTAYFHPPFAMSLGPFVFSQVVHEKNQVEQARNFVFTKCFQVPLLYVLFTLEHLVQGRYAVQDVYVGREAMVQVMLNFAGEAAEFRDKTAQYSKLVHLVESRTHVADFLQNGAESNVCRGGINEGKNQSRPTGFGQEIGGWEQVWRTNAGNAGKVE